MKISNEKKKIILPILGLFPFIISNAFASNECKERGFVYEKSKEYQTLEVVSLEEEKEPVECNLENMRIHSRSYRSSLPNRYTMFYFSCDNGSELEFPLVKEPEGSTRIGFDHTPDNGNKYDGISYVDPKGNEFSLIINRGIEKKVDFSNDCRTKKTTELHNYTFTRDDLSDKNLIFRWKSIYDGRLGEEPTF